MNIRLTDEIIEKIDNAKTERLKAAHLHGEGVNLKNEWGGGAARVYINDHYVCDFVDFFRVAKEFEMVADVIKDVAGIYIE